jgi:hypothetical protein
MDQMWLPAFEHLALVPCVHPRATAPHAPDDLPLPGEEPAEIDIAGVRLAGQMALFDAVRDLAGCNRWV